VSERSPVERHILKAAETIEQFASSSTEAVGSLKDKIVSLQNENAELRAAAENPPTTPPINLDDELAVLDEAMSHLQTAGSALRGAASAVGNAGGSTDMSTVLSQGQGTSATGGGTPAPTQPSGTQETGPSNSNEPPLDPNLAETLDTVSGADFDAAAPGSNFPGSPQAPGSGGQSVSDGGGVTPLNQNPAGEEGGGEDTDDTGDEGPLSDVP
jgi:hypothetical protein